MANYFPGSVGERASREPTYEDVVIALMISAAKKAARYDCNANITNDCADLSIRE